MNRENHKRVEFVLHKEKDRDLIEYLTQIKAGDRSEFFRALIQRAQQGDVNAESDVILSGEIKDMREMMLNFDERLTELEMMERHEEEIKHLWSEMGRMNKRFENMRVTGVVEDDELQTPAVDHETERQTVLSAKLKKMSFGVLQ